MKQLVYIVFGLLLISSLHCNFLQTETKLVDEVLNSFLDGPEDELFKAFHLMYRKQYELDSQEGERRSRNFKANLIIYKMMKDKNPELPFDSSMDSPAEEFLAFLKPYAEFPSMGLQFSGASQQTLSGHSGGIHCLVVVDSLTGTFASGSIDKTIKLWRKNSSGEYQCIQTLVGHDHYVMGLVSLTDGSFASGSYDNTIKIWKTDSTGKYKCIQSIQTDFRSLRAITTLSNGTIVCGEMSRPLVRFYAKDTSGVYQLVGTLDSTFTYGTRSILELADGSIAISSSTDGDIFLWKQNSTGQYVNTQTLTGGHTYGVLSMLRLSDNKFASASIDKSIKIWQISNGSWQCIQTLQGQSGPIYSISRITSNTEEKFASGSFDNTIYLWRLNSSKTYENYQILKEHSNAVLYIIQHPDQTLISASYDKSIKVWA